jgi:hypothetical protein
MAGRLRPQGYLIGPTIFPVYRFILRVSLLWIMVPVFIFIVGSVNYAEAERGPGDSARLGAVARRIHGSRHHHVVLRRSIVRKANSARPTAGIRNRCPLAKPQRKTSKVNVVCELIFNVFGFLWLLLCHRIRSSFWGQRRNF